MSYRNDLITILLSRTKISKLHTWNLSNDRISKDLTSLIKLDLPALCWACIPGQYRLSLSSKHLYLINSRSICFEDCYQGFIFLHGIGQFRSSSNSHSLTIFPAGKDISLISLCFQEHFCALICSDTRLSFPIDRHRSASISTYHNPQSCLSRSILVKDCYQGFIFLHGIVQFRSSSYSRSLTIFPAGKDISLISSCFQDHVCTLIYSDTRLSFPIDRHYPASISTYSDFQSCLSRSFSLKDCRQNETSLNIYSSPKRTIAQHIIIQSTGISTKIYIPFRQIICLLLKHSLPVINLPSHKRCIRLRLDIECHSIWWNSTLRGLNSIKAILPRSRYCNFTEWSITWSHSNQLASLSQCHDELLISTHQVVYR